jgi:hypothetical protein
MDTVRDGSLSITWAYPCLVAMYPPHLATAVRSRMRAVTDEQTYPPTEHDEPIDGDDLTDEERRVLANVAGILRRIKFGTVVLVVQDGKVVQIEMAEKFRLR